MKNKQKKKKKKKKKKKIFFFTFMPFIQFRMSFPSDNNFVVLNEARIKDALIFMLSDIFDVITNRALVIVNLLLQSKRFEHFRGEMLAISSDFIEQFAAIPLLDQFGNLASIFWCVFDVGYFHSLFILLKKKSMNKKEGVKFLCQFFFFFGILVFHQKMEK